MRFAKGCFVLFLMGTFLTACNTASVGAGSDSAEKTPDSSVSSDPSPGETVISDDGSIASAPMESTDGSFTSEVTLD